MAFISGGPRRGIAGRIFGQSLLPSTRQVKRRRLLSSFLPRRPSSLLLLVGLTLSFLLLLSALLRFGVPNPLSSISSHNRPVSTLPSTKPRLTRRPNVIRHTDPLSLTLGAATTNLTSATVDITTKDLYDRIEFLDVEGGPWKQGWRVSYQGNEWDNEKLKVFVVPHSHNDPGWKLTVEEYYEQQSRHILDTIVESLAKDGRRKFIWEEMSYLERWWRDSSRAMRDKFARLVRNGQLEIVGGGWVMNDEVNNTCTFLLY